MSLLVLADDLTGAADCAARCRRAGLPATIFLEAPTLPLPAGVVSLTSESREVGVSVATERVAALVSALRQAENRRWYKKIDSTLRGHLGQELDAMLAALAPTGRDVCAVICPAFPAQRRGLEDGTLVCESVAPGTMHLPTLLAEQSQRTVAAISLAVVRNGPAELAREMAAERARGKSLLVIDALSDEDLATIVTATEQTLPHALFCGSAGLIGELAARQAANEPAERASPETSFAPCGSVLAVIGSGSDMAHRQINAAKACGNIAVVAVVAVRPDTSDYTARERIADPSRPCVLHLPRPVEPDRLSESADVAWVDHLARVAAATILQYQPDCVLLAGGATAVRVLRRLGITRVTVHRELLPGMPLCRGRDASGATRWIVFKAGNHGDEQTLVDLLTRPADIISS